MKTRLQQHEQQLYDYLRIFSATWGVLTNGVDSWVYYDGTAVDVEEPVQVAELTFTGLAESPVVDYLAPIDDIDSEPEPQVTGSDIDDIPQEIFGIGDDEQVAEDPDDATDQTEQVHTVIKNLQDHTPEGVPINLVRKQAAEKLDIDPAATDREIERLKQTGKVYLPQADHSRST